MIPVDCAGCGHHYSAEVVGGHRAMCGDVTSPADIHRLLDGHPPDMVITDPPYGVNIVGGQGTAGNFPGTSAPRLKARPMHGDDGAFDPSPCLALGVPTVLWGGNHFAATLPQGHHWLVWDKKDGAFEGSDLGDCELAWTNLGGIASRLHRQTWQGMYRAGVGEGEARVHPTQKPVALMAWSITQAGGGRVVLDPYAGSGSTLIAAHGLDRAARLMDIDAHYVDVICARFQRFTGTAPVLEATGAPHDFLAERPEDRPPLHA